jgi:hypothetical protein
MEVLVLYKLSTSKYSHSVACVPAMPGSISENHFAKALSAYLIFSGCPQWIKNMYFSVNILT